MIKPLFAFLLFSASLSAKQIVLTTSGSDSMVPAIPAVKTLVVIDLGFPYSDLKRGDIVLYRSVGYGTVLHRVFRQIREGGRLVWWPKGDHNRLPDNDYCTLENYVGKLVKVIGPAGPTT